MSAAQTTEGNGVNLQKLVARAQPSAGHELINALVGEWEVEKSMYVVLGSPEKPVQSSQMRTRREWIGDGRFVRDVTEGVIAGQPYFRTGLLGFNNMEWRYEWITADNVTPTMMIYIGRLGSGPNSPIVMEGSFTDLGVTGEESVGKSIPMRTVITIQSNDLHTLEIYFTPLGKPEQLADKAIFRRIK
jgi:hypothetical protein